MRRGAPLGMVIEIPLSGVFPLALDQEIINADPAGEFEQLKLPRNYRSVRMQPQGGGGDQPLRGEKVRQEGVLGMGQTSVGPNWNGVQDGAHPERDGRQLSEEVHHLGHEKELWKRKGQGRREDSASAVDRRDRDAPEHVEAKRWTQRPST